MIRSISADKPKKRTCANRACRNKFIPARPLQSACCIGCAIVLSKDKTRKDMERAAKAERVNDKVRREKLKARSDHMREAQAEWNRYVRARDTGLPCASCGSAPEQKFGGTMDCSHYRSVGSAPHLRFHLHNAAAACVKCNRYLGGNVAALRVGLIERIGLKKVEAIEANNETLKFTIEYLRRIKSIFAKKTRRLMERRNDNA